MGLGTTYWDLSHRVRVDQSPGDLDWEGTLGLQAWDTGIWEQPVERTTKSPCETSTMPWDQGPWGGSWKLGNWVLATCLLGGSLRTGACSSSHCGEGENL
jgi:hypothetical protein